MGKTDIQFNFLSCSNNGWGYFIGGPNPKPIPSNPIHNGESINPPNPENYSVILKISDSSNDLNLISLAVAQGNQDSVNLNNGSHDISLSGNFSCSGPAGLRCITIKGGCHNINLVGTLGIHGTSEDVKIDDWSDQSYNSSDGLTLNLVASDNNPVKVVRRLGSQVTLSGGCKVAWIDSLGLTAYWWFKRIVRAICRIPVGRPGPSWLA